MAVVFTMGSWGPFAGQEDDFLARWNEFGAWASGFPGSGRAVLARDIRDPERFVSFIEWESWDAMRRWKDDPEFKPRMSKVQRHIDTFSPTEIEIVAECRDGRVGP